MADYVEIEVGPFRICKFDATSLWIERISGEAEGEAMQVDIEQLEKFFKEE